MSFSMKELLAESQPSQSRPSQPQASQPQASSPSLQPESDPNSFSMAELTKDDEQKAQADGQQPQIVTGGPDAEEQAFLKSHPNHAWVPADPKKFPNRPAGIYPTGPGNEWRNDPSYSQAPIDLHLAKDTAEGAATGAVPVALAAGLPALTAVPEAAGLAKNYILKKLAEESPTLFGHEAVKETLKRYALEGVKKAMAGGLYMGGAEILHSIWDDVLGSKKKK